MLVAAELATSTNPAAKWNMRLSRIKTSKMSKNHLISTCPAAERLSRATGAEKKIIFELRDRAPGYLMTLLTMLFALLGKLERWYFLLLNY